MKNTIEALMLPLFLMGGCFVSSCGGGVVDPLPPVVVTLTSQVKPHVFFILLDDLGVDAGPCSGNGFNLMPNLEKRCASSLVFNEAYAYSSCTPSRAALMTGNHSFRHGANDVHSSSTKLPLSSVTIPEAIRSQGSEYRSSAFGKWHLADDGNGDSDNPNLQGFDHYEGTPRQTGTYVYPPDEYEWFVNGHNTGLAKKYKTTQIVDAVISDFNKNHDASPQFSYVAMVNPHLPYHLPPSDLHSYVRPDPSEVLPFNINSTPVREPLADPYYFAMLEAVDNEINRLVTSVTNASDRPVLFVLMGDNGSAEQVTQVDAEGLRRNKATVFQGGIRVPLMTWSSEPDRFRVDVGQSSEDVIINDWHPTLVKIMGGGDVQRDGLNLSEIIDDNAAQLDRDYIYFESGHTRKKSFIYTAIRRDGMKLTLSETARDIRKWRTDYLELYDINSDPLETNNLIGSCGHIDSALDILSYMKDLRDSQDVIVGGDAFDYDFYVSEINKTRC